ncbi:MAG: ABC transporter substrate-binding protein [Dehalococcoidia bacterium]|nr:ABC transporter substrate-binding protein [Dehalococcoidia bacterium]MDW8119709.1 ABC transporter substrate-binding protein [Chloroflexota bacterium]
MRRTAIIVLVTLLWVLVGCAPQRAAPTPTPQPPRPAAPVAQPPQTPPAATPTPARPAPSGEIVIALTDEPQNLNPIFMDFYAGNWKSFNGLVKYDQNLQLVPDLAAQMPEISADGRTVTVRLKPGVRFHDGHPLTAEDVVFTWRALADPKVASTLRDRFDLANVLEDVQAVDSVTVRFHLKRPDAAFLHKLYVGIVPKHLLEGQDLNTAAFNRQPVGTGPYVFKEWRAGERIVMEANPDYHGGPVGIARLIFVFINDENARAAQLLAGTVDVAGLPPRLAATFQNNPRFRVYRIPSADARVAVLPYDEPNLKDPRVRRALSMAVNRQAIVDGVLLGAGEPAYGPFIAGAPPPVIPYDPEGAKRLLQEAGWTPGPDGFMQKDGRRLTFTLMHPAHDSVRRDIALAIRSDLQRIGVDVQVEGLGWTAIRERFGKAGNVFGWGQPYDPDLEIYRLFHSIYAYDDAPFTNPARIINPEIDRALDEGRREYDQRRRLEAYSRLQRLIQEDGHWLFTVYLTPIVVTTSKITNVQIQREGHAHGFSRGMSWNLESWRIER